VKPKIRCAEREQLFAYACGMLNPREAGELGTHIRQCEACLRVVESYRWVDEVLDAWRPEEPSPSFDSRVQAAIATGAATSAGLWARLKGGLRDYWWGSGRRLAPVMVAMAVAVVSVVVLRERHTPLRSPGQTQQVVRTIKQPPSGAGLSQASSEASSSAVDDYDILANFELLSELPKGHGKPEDN
jgi:anti-sigma factor RsiW